MGTLWSRFSEPGRRCFLHWEWPSSVVGHTAGLGCRLVVNCLQGVARSGVSRGDNPAEQENVDLGAAAAPGSRGGTEAGLGVSHSFYQTVSTRTRCLYAGV